MEFKVKKIHLTAEDKNDKDYNPENGNTDVIVFLEKGKKYIASFFSYANINKMQQQHQKNGNYIKGSYFWKKNMVLVKDCSINTIESAINDFIDEGDFQDAFMEL